MTEKDILNLISSDKWMMEVLHHAQSLNLPDWMIGAGFVRNKVWDHLHGYKSPTALSDIDVIYFDNTNLNEEIEKEYENRLKQKLNVPWSVTNQARMHIDNQDLPYKSSEDAMRYWPETATATAVSLKDGLLELIAPYGIADLVNLNVKLSPNFTRHIDMYKNRIERKQWKTKWPQLTIFNV